MKRCPKCRRDYGDETLNYCLDDGAALLDGPGSGDEPSTRLMPEPKPAAEWRANEFPSSVYPSNTAERVAKNDHRLESERPSSGTEKRSGLRVALAAGVLIAVLLGGFFAYRYLNVGRSDQITTIAVMPFVNASGTANAEYLSDGITESLIGSLSRIPDLTVKSRSAVFRLKGKDIDPQAAGRELNVQAVLNGRLTQRGDNLTLFIELIDTATENSLWQQTYDRPMTTLAALQSEVARDIAQRLRAKLSGAEKSEITRSYTDNPEAYNLYLLGSFHWGKRTKADAHKAIEYYKQAVAKDPDYALAYAGLSDVYAALQGYDSAISPRESLELSRAYGLRAVSIDDSLSEAHVAVGRVSFIVDHDFSAGESSLKRAIELDSKNANAFIWYGHLLSALGRFEESEANYEIALALDPTSAMARRGYSQFLMMAGRFRECEEQLRKTLELEPHFQIGHLSLANVLAVQGRYAESVDQYAKAREAAGRPDEGAAIREIFAQRGWRGLTLHLERSDSSREMRPQYISAARLASIGETDLALARLESAYEDREGFVILMNVDPRLQPLRNEPRFIELLRKTGFAR